MKGLWIGGFALALVALPVSGAMAQSKLEKARAECRAEHSNVGNFRAQERGGQSISQKVSECVKKKMSGKG